MKIVIAGDGKVGFTLAEQLSRENHDVVVIDNDPFVLQRSQELLDVQVMTGNGASLDMQREAGVAHSDVLIAVTTSDEVNILCCAVAKKLGCKHTIARVRNPDYTRQLRFLRDELGLSMTVNPEYAAAGEIFRMLRYPEFLMRDTFARGRVEIVMVAVEEDSPLAGLPLMRAAEVLKVKSLICAVEREGDVTIPGGSFVIEEGDNITLAARVEDLPELIASLNISSPRIKNAMLIGGGMIARYLAQELLLAGVRVKIIEINMERCMYLSEKLPGAVIINGDGSDQSLLSAENIESMDAVVTLTNTDEENLIISMFADYLDVPKVVTKIARIDYVNVFRSKGIGSVVSPKLLAAESIVRYVRALGAKPGTQVLALHRIVDENAEALEFLAGQSTKHIGTPLATTPIRKNTLIACIIRGSDVIIPKGGDCIYLGDTVIVVTLSEHAITTLNDIYED